MRLTGCHVSVGYPPLGWIQSGVRSALASAPSPSVRDRGGAERPGSWWNFRHGRHLVRASVCAPGSPLVTIIDSRDRKRWLAAVASIQFCLVQSSTRGGKVSRSLKASGDTYSWYSSCSFLPRGYMPCLAGLALRANIPTPAQHCSMFPHPNLSDLVLQSRKGSLRKRGMG